MENRAREIYQNILQSLSNLKAEIEGSGESGKREAEIIDNIIATLKSLKLQTGEGGG